jgi:ABC-2 type transport system ATP-binding protein
MNVAELQGVTKRYGAVTALHDVDFAIGEGELVALLGPNGAGKTTAVSLLLGLAQASAGAVKVFGKDPRDRAVRQRCGALLQVGGVPGTMKVREHVDLFSSYYPKPMAFAEVVAAAGLQGMENRLFADLSGGQKQRVLFALAICGNPALLFLDEPTVGLDVEARRALWEHIRGFVRRGGSVLLTTHYLEEADALANRIVVIDRGRIAASGTPQEIKARTSTRKVRCVTALSEAELRAVQGVASVSIQEGRAEILTASPERVARELLMRDASLKDLEIAAGGLEDAFLALTKNQESALQEVA